GLPGFDLPDPITVAIAIAPEMIRRSEFVSMDVSCSEEMRGTIIIDRRHTAPPANVDVIWEVDRDVFLNSLYEVCKNSSNPSNYKGVSF
ncbi:MAG: nucleoside hydrolase, partial [Actinomycetes bacterium]